MKTELKNTMLVWRQGLYFSIVKSKSLNCEAFFGEWKPLQYDDRRYPTWKQESMEQRMNILREKTFPQKRQKKYKHIVNYEIQFICHWTSVNSRRMEKKGTLPSSPDQLQNPHKRRKTCGCILLFVLEWTKIIFVWINSRSYYPMLPLGKLNISIFNSYLCHRRFLHRQKRTTHFCNRNVNFNFTSEYCDISAYKTDKSFYVFPSPH